MGSKSKWLRHQILDHSRDTEDDSAASMVEACHSAQVLARAKAFESGQLTDVVTASAGHAMVGSIRPFSMRSANCNETSQRDIVVVTGDP